MSHAVPAGKEGFIPHICCTPCSDALEFYKKAFGAVEISRMPGPGGKLMHAEMKIGDKVLFLADDFPEFCGGKASDPNSLGGSPVTIHCYVENCDELLERAIAAGCKPLMPVQDMFWGDRYGAILDPFGHKWSIASHQRVVSNEEMQQAMAAMFGPA